MKRSTTQRNANMKFVKKGQFNEGIQYFLLMPMGTHCGASVITAAHQERVFCAHILNAFCSSISIGKIPSMQYNKIEMKWLSILFIAQENRDVAHTHLSHIYKYISTQKHSMAVCI